VSIESDERQHADQSAYSAAEITVSAIFLIACKPTEVRACRDESSRLTPFSLVQTASETSVRSIDPDRSWISSALILVGDSRPQLVHRHSDKNVRESYGVRRLQID
jgi:hypothetical protein